MTRYAVLIVEDSVTMRQLLSFALRKLRVVDVDTADDGLDALKKLSAKPYDLVITDINMPMMDGFKLLSMIRHKDTEVPIIVITTEGSDDDRKRAMTLGANIYLTKPIQAPDVTRACRELLHLDP